MLSACEPLPAAVVPTSDQIAKPVARALPVSADAPRSDSIELAYSAEPSRAVELARNFTTELAKLLRTEHGAMVDFLLALGEFDARRLWGTLGYPSLFEFLHRELGLSRSAAYYRSAAAGLVQRHPEVIEPLADGRLCLTSLAQVAKVISRENANEILPRFFRRSSREAKDIAAEIAPVAAPPTRDVLTMLPRRRGPLTGSSNRTTSPATPDLGQNVQAIGRESSRVENRDRDKCVTADRDAYLDRNGREPGGNGRAERASSGSETALQPLTGELRRIHITVSRQWVEKLERAKAALSHSIPSGSAERVIEAALDALLERVAERQRLVAKSRPKSERNRAAWSVARADEPAPVERGETVAAAAARGATAKSAPLRRRGAIPVQVRRAVPERDKGRCQAKLHDGTICGSTLRLELDHIQPVALGGSSTIENLRVICRRHNQLAAREVFGDAWMDHVSSRGAG